MKTEQQLCKDSEEINRPNEVNEMMEMSKEIDRLIKSGQWKSLCEQAQTLADYAQMYGLKCERNNKHYPQFEKYLDNLIKREDTISTV